MGCDDGARRCARGGEGIPPAAPARRALTLVAGALAVAVVAAPVVALTTPGTILLALAALATLVYGDRSDVMVAAAGAGLVLVELEHAWSGDPAELQAAAAAAGMALLVASELRAWSRRLGEAAPDAAALRALAAGLTVRLAAIAVATAVFAVLAQATVDAPLFAVAGSVAAVAVFAALLRLVRGLR